MENEKENNFSNGVWVFLFDMPEKRGLVLVVLDKNFRRRRTMKTKRAINMVVFMALIGFCTNLWGAQYGSKPSVNVSPPPDLTVTAKIIKVEKFKNSKGIQCYGIRPYFTITNNGGSVARNFRYEIEWNYNPTHTWQIYTVQNNVFLGPGNTITIDGSGPVWNLPWCADEHDWTPGWRIRVDTGNVVSESNEQNNSAVIHFYMLKGKPPVHFQPGGKK